jgi:hypothetical protein
MKENNMRLSMAHVAERAVVELFESLARFQKIQKETLPRKFSTPSKSLRGTEYVSLRYLKRRICFY